MKTYCSAVCSISFTRAAEITQLLGKNDFNTHPRTTFTYISSDLFIHHFCLGENLAEMELFILFSHVMHRFTFMKPAEAPPLTLEGQNSIAFSPLPFEICAVERD